MIFDDIVNGINDILYTGSAGILNNCFGSDQMKSVVKLLYMSGDTYNEHFWGTVNSVLNVIKPFGYAFIATFFIIFMLDQASKDRLSIDSIIKTMIQLIIVVGIAGNIDLIINALLSIGESMLSQLDKISSSAASDFPTGENIVQSAKDNGVSAISLFLESIVCWLFHQIAIIGIDLAAITRAIEIGWRSAFAPIGLANSFEGGASSQGVRYIKGLGGAILSGALMWLICAVGFSISAGFLSSDSLGFSSLFAAVAALFATAGACIGAINKVKEITG